MPISRRHFLRDGAHALAVAPLFNTVAPGDPETIAEGEKNRSVRAAARDIVVRDVAGLSLISGSGCNVVALPGPDGALMIDGGLAVNSDLLLKAVFKATKTSRVATLINTHWHPQQTGSNEVSGKAGAQIIAHEVSRLALGARNRSAVFEGIYGPLPPAGIPTLTTYNTGSLQVAGEQVDYRYLPGAHTNGDLFVHFPKRNVIVAGGPVGSDRWPVIDYLNGGFMHGFVRSYEILCDVAQPDTIIVPAQGPTLTGADILRMKDLYWDLFKQFFIVFNKGAGPQEVVELNRGIDFATVGNIVAPRPITKEWLDRLGDPAQFLDAAYRSTQMATIPF
jgi:glyoxylase-like metal-dependent hydrolase (beta-lactamase superfamily II)